MNDRTRLLSGARPTGGLHLGHLVGALLPLKDFPGQDKMFVVSDLHMLTTRFSRAVTDSFGSTIRQLVAECMAAGLDDVTFYVQSGVPQQAQIYAIVQSLVHAESLPEHESYQEMARHADVAPSLGLLGYPVLEAADVISMAATHVAVGPHNLSHLALGQELVRRLVTEWGCDFTPAQPVTGPAVNLPGLDGKEKMSKSLGNAIQLSDSADEVAEKVRSIAVHDDRGTFVLGAYLEALGVETDPEVLRELADRCRDMAQARRLRERVLAAVDDVLAPVRARLGTLEQHPGLVDERLAAGRTMATKIAQEQLDEFSRKLGVPLASSM